MCNCVLSFLFVANYYSCTCHFTCHFSLLSVHVTVVFLLCGSFFYVYLHLQLYFVYLPLVTTTAILRVSKVLSDESREIAFIPFVPIQLCKRKRYCRCAHPLLCRHARMLRCVGNPVTILYCTRYPVITSA